MNMNLGDTRLIVDACRNNSLLRNQAACVLAMAYHETAHTMKPVRETLADSDAKAKAILTKAFKAGKLPWVKADYWSGGYFGRGYSQLTHEPNYRKAGRALGIDLVKNPSRALEPGTAAQILVVGMKYGWFTGKKLSDYVILSRSDYFNARTIINGDKNKIDKATGKKMGELIAGYARDYDAALRAEGYGVEIVTETVVVEVEKPVVADPGELGTPAGKSKTVWLSIFTALGTPLAAFGGLDWRVQMALVVAVVGFAMYAIKRRFDLAKAVRDLHSELAE